MENERTPGSRVRRDARVHAFLTSVAQHVLFRLFMLLIIYFDAVLIALDVSNRSEVNKWAFLQVADKCIVVIYVLEIGVMVYLEPRAFWRKGLNWVITTLLLMSLPMMFLHGHGSANVVLSLRCLRICKCLLYLPSIQEETIMHLRILKPLGHITLLIIYFMVAYAVVAVYVFGQNNGELLNWASLETGMRSVLRLLTLDNWLELQRSLEHLQFTSCWVFYVAGLAVCFISQFIFKGVLFMSFQSVYEDKRHKREDMLKRQAAIQQQKNKRCQQSQASKIIRERKHPQDRPEEMKRFLSSQDFIVLKDSMHLSSMNLCLMMMASQEASLDNSLTAYNEVLAMVAERWGEKRK